MSGDAEALHGCEVKTLMTSDHTAFQGEVGRRTKFKIVDKNKLPFTEISKKIEWRSYQKLKAI